ncbi:hypothetical protein [Fibrella arboris]|uniref:hypothetical protein n=1 Tax=Fibrella arboris TaxID=3242486 RepID=UPI00352129EC
MTQGTRLNELINCCENRFNRGGAGTWKHGDFVDLNRAIERDTNTNISPSTLKRIFGKVAVDDDYVPQKATLDALKKYGNYIEPEPLQTPVSQPTTRSRVNYFYYWKILLITLTVSALLGTVFLIWHLFKPNDSFAKISLVRLEGQLPATTFFELRVSETDDSLFVNFGDKSPLVYIKAGEKSAAHIYYFPGVFTVSVQTRSQTIATTSAYIRSDKWIGFACHRQDDIPVHFYAFPVNKNKGDSVVQVTTNQLTKMGLDTTGPILTRFCNYTPMADNADDFVFETTFKNALPDKAIYCRSTQFQLTGSNSMIRFKFVSSGCSLRALNVVSEQTFKGSKSDLSRFVLDLNNWNTVKLINHHRQVALYVNDKQIFTGTYQRPLGTISGLFLEFEGTGSVKNCYLNAYDGKVLYQL